MLVFDNEYVEGLFIAWSLMQGYIEDCDIKGRQVPKKILQIQADLEDELRYEFEHADFKQVYQEWSKES